MENLASEDEARSLIKSGRTHRDICILLQTKYPGITILGFLKGMCVDSVKKTT